MDENSRHEPPTPRQLLGTKNRQIKDLQHQVRIILYYSILSYCIELYNII